MIAELLLSLRRCQIISEVSDPFLHGAFVFLIDRLKDRTSRRHVRGTVGRRAQIRYDRRFEGGEISMLISEMSRNSVRIMLSRQGSGGSRVPTRIAPYIVPIYFAYEPDHIYGFTTLGQKSSGCVRIHWPAWRLRKS